jgi:hypothetical protein
MPEPHAKVVRMSEAPALARALVVSRVVQMGRTLVADNENHREPHDADVLAEAAKGAVQGIKK